MTTSAFLGLDWAEAQHDVCLHAAGATQRECCLLEHTPEAIDTWGNALRTRCNGRPIAVCLARNQGPSVSALRQYDCLVLFPIKPLTLARSRAAFTPSRAEDDPTDAALQLALLLPHPNTLQPLRPQRPALRAREQLVEHRRCVGDDNVRLTHRLPRTLNNYFPHVLHWLQDKDTPVLCAFLSRWPPLNAAQLARRSTLETFCRDQHVRSADVINQRLQAIKTASPWTTDEGVIAPNALVVHALVAQLRVTLQALAAFDHASAQRAQPHPAFPLFQALPGAGPVCAPRLLGAFGEQRERSASAAALQPYAGIAPVTARSAKQSWLHWRLQGPKFLRQTCVEWAAASIRHAFWARVYSQQPRDKGKAHQAAVRARAFTWIRILSRGWQDRTPYDESSSLQALHNRGASLLHNLVQRS